jgi:pyruvate/2-oxoglutarate dehydrogenase complex dihydrolipoamide acyltransferase (E2) component
VLHQVRLPRLGETVDEVEVLEWQVQVGDTVTEGDPLLIVATDKVDTDVPAPVNGVVTGHLVSTGSIITTGTVVCTIESPSS